MRPARSIRISLIAFFVLLPLSLRAGGSSTAQQTTSTEVLAVLQTLGAAYAADTGLNLETSSVTLAGLVSDENVTEWVTVLNEALVVGYAPPGEPFSAIDLDVIEEYITVEMGGSRTPSEVVSDVLTAGNSVVQVTWTFSGAQPVMSYAVFSPANEPQFDTLLFMPVITSPIGLSGHF